MSRIAQQSRQATGIRAFGRRFGRTGAAAGALALAVPLTLSLAPQALAQSSGIYINNDVLNSLGPGPGAAPSAPLAPAAPAANPALPVQPLAPQPRNDGSLSFQTYGSGNYVVTRPGTLLFPPLEAPTSTLAPGFTDNHAARTEAMNNAFAEGPEPSSQLLIPLDSGAASDGSVMVFMDNLPPADPEAAAGDAPVLTLRRPGLATPQPAPRKPEVSAEMLAETGAISIDDTPAALAPEFQTPEPLAPMTAELPAAVPVEKTPLEAAPAAPAMAETIAPSEPPANEPAMAVVAEPAALEMPATAKPAADRPMAEPAAAVETAEAKMEPAPVSSAEMTAPVTTQVENTAPVSLLPPASDAAMAGSPVPSAEVPAPVTQTAALPRSDDVVTAAAAAPGNGLAADAAMADMSLVFDSDSAELSALVQNELRSLAHSMRAQDDGRIQVLGFASAEDGSDDLARRLALSRALKVRTFLIDAGVPSTRIQVRSLGTQSDGGPANRVDIRPIDS